MASPGPGIPPAIRHRRSRPRPGKASRGSSHRDVLRVGAHGHLPCDDRDRYPFVPPLGADPVRNAIVGCVDFAVRSVFPDKYFTLCHAYAIVGSNVATIVLGSEYRPVAGLAVMDCGGGRVLPFTDGEAFASGIGGAYHSWIESVPADGEGREIVDMHYLHNATYARQYQVPWLKGPSTYLWDRFDDVVMAVELDALPVPFPEGKAWYREVPDGGRWMLEHIRRHQDEYVRLTALALKHLLQESPAEGNG